jgi:LemA protein
MWGTYIVIGLVVLIGLWAIGAFNRLVRLRNLVAEGWSGIDAQLKRRFDLIPNLVETVKGYATHERTTLDELARLRTSAGAQSSDPATRGVAESQISAMIGRVFAVAEAYPELKASANFQALQQSLAEVEDQIQLSRRYYNGTVRELNTAVEQIPTNFVAGLGGFKPAAFFQIDNEAERAAPKVSFS